MITIIMIIIIMIIIIMIIIIIIIIIIKESSSLLFFFINFKLKKGKEKMLINERHIYNNKNETLNVFIK